MTEIEGREGSVNDGSVVVLIGGGQRRGPKWTVTIINDRDEELERKLLLLQLTLQSHLELSLSN